MLIFSLFLAFITKDNRKELELIQRIGNRDQNALADLYDLYSKLLFSIIFKIVKKQENAEDILQAVFLQVWDKADSFDLIKGSVFTWLTTIARNKSIDFLRSKNYKKEMNTLNNLEKVDRIVENDAPLSIDMIIEAEKSEIVLKSLQKIPGEQRQILELAYFEGYTQSEISEMLNIPLGTIKSRTRQALSKLENLLISIL